MNPRFIESCSHKRKKNQTCNFPIRNRQFVPQPSDPSCTGCVATFGTGVPGQGISTYNPQVDGQSSLSGIVYVDGSICNKNNFMDSVIKVYFCTFPARDGWVVYMDNCPEEGTSITQLPQCGVSSTTIQGIPQTSFYLGIYQLAFLSTITFGVAGNGQVNTLDLTTTIIPAIGGTVYQVSLSATAPLGGFGTIIQS